MKKIKAGDFVVYTPIIQRKSGCDMITRGPMYFQAILEKAEFGIVKEIIETRDGKEMYRVYYHTGDTSALTNLRDLTLIVNGSMIKEMIEKFGDLK